MTLLADSAEALFVEGARVVARECGPATGEHGDWQHVSLVARDLATLLVDWLNDVIGRSEIDCRAFDDVLIARLDAGDGDASIDADIRGREVTAWLSPLKAATYHDLQVTRDDSGWRATVVIDV